MAIGAIANRTFCCRDAPERQVAEVLPLVLGGFLYLFYAIFIISLCAAPKAL
jgi:hypothetical protein